MTPPPLPPIIPDGKNLDGFDRLPLVPLAAAILPPAPVSEDGAGAVSANALGRIYVGPAADFDFIADLIGFADRSGFEGCRPA